MNRSTVGRSIIPGVLPAVLTGLLGWAAMPLYAQITITEIMYNYGVPAGEDRRREFIEIFNTSPEPLDLSGYSVSRGVDFTFGPGTWLNGHAYLAICADPAFIASTYAISNTAGPWAAATSLANGGETIAIAEPSGVEVASVRYNDRGKWAAAADGAGHSLALTSPYSELDDPDSWAHSSARGGSPGKVNPAPGARPVFFNEGLVWTSGERWIEIHNPSAAAVNLANYYLTDTPLNLTRARLGAVSVPAKGWLALSDAALGLDYTPVPNPPNPGVGRTFVALVDPAGARVVDAYTFEPDLVELSEARYPDGDEDWADAATPTRGAANAVQVTTDVVISEIMYHSQDDDPSDEFVELHNRGTSGIDLDGCRFTQGIDFLFPAVTIPPGGFLVVARNPERIRSVYGLPASKVVGPAQDPDTLAAFGVLANGGERLTLVDRNRNVMDTLRFYDGGDWPRWADGLGSSLELIDPFADNSLPTAWDSSDDSEKAITETFTYTGRHANGTESELHFVLMNRGIALVDDVEVRSGGGSLVVDSTFIDFGASFKYQKGNAEASAPVTAWRAIGFNDAAWVSGATPIGYGEPDIVTPITDMQNGYLTFYCRRAFNVTNRLLVDRLFIDVRYDDGFIAYLNGTQVASRAVTGSAFNSPAAGAIEPTQEQIEITEFKSALVNGTNVLAVQVHNANLGSTDALLNVRLVSGHIETGGAGPNLILNGTFDQDDGGWIIEGNHIDSGRTAAYPLTGAGSLKVIATGRGDNKVNRIETETSPAMNATDTYTVSFKARWVVGSRTLLTHDYQNLDTSLARAHHFTVPEDIGTPGALNSVTARRVAARGSPDLGPTIARVSQSPVVPQANEAVTVRARITDPDGVASARVFYYLNTPGAGQSVNPLTDPDGDGVYTATLPGRALGQKVLYWIEAADLNGNVERYPADLTARSHPLSLDPAGADPAALSYCIYRHDTRNIDPASPFHKYRFILHDLNEAYLDQRQVHSNDLVEGTFVFGGADQYYNSRIRFAGSPWARGKWGSFRLRFPNDKPLHGSKSSFNLDMKHGDPLNARERLSNYLFRANSRPGAPAPYGVYRIVRLWVNSRDIGFRDHTEVPNGDFLEKWWPGDDRGDFFEMDDRFEFNDGGGRIASRDGRLTYPPYGGSGDDQEEYRWYLNPRRDEDGDNFANLIDLARLLDPGDTGDALFDAAIGGMINLESFLRVWSVRLNTDDWDQWGTNRGKNCYLFRPPGDGRWHLIPWDMELTYAGVDAFPHPTGATGAFGFGFAEVNRLLNRPRIRRLYYGILKEMVDGPFSSAHLQPYMATLDTLGISTGASTAHGKAGGYVDQRRTRILSWINPVVSPQVDLAVTSPNAGNPASVATATVDLGGTAPVEVFQVAVENDALDYQPGDVPPAVFSATSMTGWTVRGIPLSEGINNLTVYGLTSQGELVDQDSIRITATGTWNAPSITALEPGSGRPGDVVTITGADFRVGIQVLFGTTPASAVDFQTPDPTHVRATVPALAPASYQARVRNSDGKQSTTLPFTVSPPPPEFIRGDPNLDGRVDISDALKILFHLFAGQAVDCQDAVDANDSGTVNASDALLVLDFLFRSGPAPLAPHPAKGVDPTPGDPYGCVQGLP